MVSTTATLSKRAVFMFALVAVPAVAFVPGATLPAPHVRVQPKVALRATRDKDSDSAGPASAGSTRRSVLGDMAKTAGAVVVGGNLLTEAVGAGAASATATSALLGEEALATSAAAATATSAEHAALLQRAQAMQRSMASMEKKIFTKNVMAGLPKLR